MIRLQTNQHTNKLINGSQFDGNQSGVFETPYIIYTQILVATTL